MPITLVNAACAVIAAAAIPAIAAGYAAWPGSSDLPMAETVEIAAGSVSLPRPGQYLVNGRRVAALVDRVDFPRPVTIMKHQVSLADYRRCVDSGACVRADAAPAADAEAVPVTGVSLLDAEAYAAWYSTATGASWRLPTAAEWAYAAAERFVGDPAVAADDPGNPAVAWIRRYRAEAADRREPEPQPMPRGSYGPNSHGVHDLGGNVWEWTSACYARVTLDKDRKRIEYATENCGIGVAEGRHRAYMPAFVRDGKSGACAVDTPPDNLGFRLVRDGGAQPVVAHLMTTILNILPTRSARRS